MSQISKLFWASLIDYYYWSGVVYTAIIQKSIRIFIVFSHLSFIFNVSFVQVDTDRFTLLFPYFVFNGFLKLFMLANLAWIICLCCEIRKAIIEDKCLFLLILQTIISRTYFHTNQTLGGGGVQLSPSLKNYFFESGLQIQIFYRGSDTYINNGVLDFKLYY